MNSFIKPSVVFKNEIACIADSWYSDIFIKAISKAPDYFWVVPSSTSGKYHPESDLGIGGNVRHTKAVFWVLEELLSNTGLYPFEDWQKDSLRVAALLHDSVKLGLNGGEHTVHNHPMLIRENLCPCEELPWNTKEEEEKWNYICDLIESHMGMWNTKEIKPGREANPGDEVVLPLPDTPKKQLLHLADYIASRKRISVSLVGKPESTVSKEPATEAQVKYIKGLIDKCTSKGIHLTQPTGKTTKAEASKIIKDLLELLK